jgi:hypothetical protein
MSDTTTRCVVLAASGVLAGILAYAIMGSLWSAILAAWISILVNALMRP